MKFKRSLKQQDSMAPNKPHRRSFLKSLTFSAAAVMGAGMLTSTPALAAQTWKIQSTWDAGTVGYTMFEEWCNSM